MDIQNDLHGIYMGSAGGSKTKSNVLSGIFFTPGIYSLICPGSPFLRVNADTMHQFHTFRRQILNLYWSRCGCVVLRYRPGEVQLIDSLCVRIHGIMRQVRNSRMKIDRVTWYCIAAFYVIDWEETKVRQFIYHHQNTFFQVNTFNLTFRLNRDFHERCNQPSHNYVKMRRTHLRHWLKSPAYRAISMYVYYSLLYSLFVLILIMGKWKSTNNTI